MSEKPIPDTTIPNAICDHCEKTAFVPDLHDGEDHACKRCDGQMKPQNAKAKGQFTHLSFGGSVYSIDWGKIGWRFEMHPHCGPVVVDRLDEPVAKQPAENSGFWKAVTLWIRQGQQATLQGKCIYQEGAA